MARGIEGNEMSTPKVPKLKSSTSASKSNQQSIRGFFSKKSELPSSPTIARDDPDVLPPSSLPTPSSSHEYANTIVPTQRMADKVTNGSNKENEGPDNVYSSPDKRTKKKVSYAESEDDEEPVAKSATQRAAKRRRISVLDDSDDGDSFQPQKDVNDNEQSDQDMDDFVVPDNLDDDDEAPRRSSKVSKKEKKKSGTATPTTEDSTTENLVIPSQSTAQQWKFDSTIQSSDRQIQYRAPRPETDGRNQKPHMTESEKRYAWLAEPLDADRNPPGHADFDIRTIYIPPAAWAKFSPFEKQYWEVKQKLWDTVVFFKKGKFYELYEKDATIGNQEFDLKLTDRVNMRMVGVPEASLEYWTNQFLAKNHKVARVDQMESALAKDMRERGEKATGQGGKEEKVIRRELAAVFTKATLVDGGLLHDDMATYCAAIKESEIDGNPAFGIAFVDTATGHFQFTDFIDDVDLTKFETFIAQIRPAEVLLERGYISKKSERILKHNTPPGTIWTYFKPEREFLTPEKTSLMLDAEKYFDADNKDNTSWPIVLREARDKENVYSAFGALINYLKSLKIERDLLTLGNFSWYDPIRKASSLVLDGQSLINLEIFANTFDGGANGTLFSMLNRCITPFGKRMLRQWVCHPLVDAVKINARLDAVDALNADNTLTDRFTESLSKLPDLERIISRIHAGQCKTPEFVKVLEAFEQIEYTMSLIARFGEGDGIIGQLIKAMPDLSSPLKYWTDAFDRSKARDNGIMVPAPGVESDFDDSEEQINKTLHKLDDLLKRSRQELGSSAIKYTDNGKEIYQMEVPLKVKGIPKSWRQMSATKTVKRYYFTELESLVQDLKEAQETHAQIVKQVAGRFFIRFDENYDTWLASVKIVAHLDCLISLAKASASLGSPSCRPTFIERERTVLDFTELRHPTMLTTASDFIPNDILLGGEHSSNITLLTGANAAGKSTVLRMTCVAVILAQIGCHVPCSNATLTPVDRIMSRLGAHDNIFAGQSTFMVELSETKKILSEATSKSLVILDELGRGTSSHDGVAVAQAVLHHIATHVGCVGFFATHYHSLAQEFASHAEVRSKTMSIQVDDEERKITFLYKLIDGVAEGSFGMHCAAMCGISKQIIDRAEVAADMFEHTSRMIDNMADKTTNGQEIGLGWLSDVSWWLKMDNNNHEFEKDEEWDKNGLEGLDVLRKAIESF